MVIGNCNYFMIIVAHDWNVPKIQNFLVDFNRWSYEHALDWYSDRLPSPQVYMNAATDSFRGMADKSEADLLLFFFQ